MKGTSREKPEMMVAPFDSRTRISLPSSFNDTRKREKNSRVGQPEIGEYHHFHPQRLRYESPEKACDHRIIPGTLHERSPMNDTSIG